MLDQETAEGVYAHARSFHRVLSEQKAAAAASVAGVAGKENTAAGRGGGIGTSYM